MPMKQIKQIEICDEIDQLHKNKSMLRPSEKCVNPMKRARDNLSHIKERSNESYELITKCKMYLGNLMVKVREIEGIVGYY